MNRTEFLKILGVTPFAIKSLIMTHGKNHIEKNSDNFEEIKSLNENAFLFKVDNKEFGISRHGCVNIYNQRWDIEFDNMICVNDFNPFEIINKREVITIEMYREDHGLFNTFEGVFNEIEVNELGMYSGVVTGI